MEQDEVIQRLKGLGRASTPPAPDFSAPVVPVKPAGRARFGVGPVIAVVGVLALGTAALAVPDGGPLRQAVASLSTEVETDPAEVEAEIDGDDSGATGTASLNPCDGPPPTGTPADAAGEDGVEGGVAVEVSPEDREAQVQAWREWREANCGPEANADAGDDDEADEESDDSDDPEGSDGHGRGKGENGNPPAHPHEDDPCKGPPPHSNRPGSGDPGRDEAQRKAEQEAWHRWHHENCPPGQTGEHPGRGEGKPDDAGRSENAGRPDDAGRPEGTGRPDNAGRPDGAGRPGSGEAEDS